MKCIRCNSFTTRGEQVFPEDVVTNCNGRSLFRTLAAAIEALRGTEASSREFHPGVWYVCVTEDFVDEHHLEGFTEAEEAAIFEEVTCK